MDVLPLVARPRIGAEDGRVHVEPTIDVISRSDIGDLTGPRSPLGVRVEPRGHLRRLYNRQALDRRRPPLEPDEPRPARESGCGITQVDGFRGEQLVEEAIEA